MILFSKKHPAAVETAKEEPARRESTPAERVPEENRFDEIRRKAAEGHRKSDTDGTLRRARQTAEDNRLL